MHSGSNVIPRRARPGLAGLRPQTFVCQPPTGVSARRETSTCLLNPYEWRKALRPCALRTAVSVRTRQCEPNEGLTEGRVVGERPVAVTSELHRGFRKFQFLLQTMIQEFSLHGNQLLRERGNSSFPVTSEGGLLEKDPGGHFHSEVRSKESVLHIQRTGRITPQGSHLLHVPRT